MSGKCHFKIANQRVVFKRHWNKMLWHFQNKPFLLRNVDMYVLSPYILGTVENVCHVSFILEAPKLHVLGFSFFFPRHFWGFLVSFNSCWAIASAETRKGRRVTWGMEASQVILTKGPGSACNSWLCLQGTGPGLQQHLGQSPGCGWRQEHYQCPLISEQRYWGSSSEERVEATGDGCVQLYGAWFWMAMPLDGWFSNNQIAGTSLSSQ